MIPKWFIENNCYTDQNPEKLRDAAIKRGCEVSWFRYDVHCADKKQKLPFNLNDCAISYGSIEFIRMMQRTTAWTPGAWANWENLKASVYLSHWGKYSIHNNYAFITLGELIRDKERLFRMFAVDNRLFVKSDSSQKHVYGDVVHYDGFDKWRKEIDIWWEPPLHTLLLISGFQPIRREWRLIIADRKSITGSRYKLEDSVEIDPDVPQKVYDFADEVVNSGTFEPEPMYTIDIAEVNDTLRLVEIGSWNSSGLYDCDKDKIVEAANSIAIREWNELQ